MSFVCYFVRIFIYITVQFYLCQFNILMFQQQNIIVCVCPFRKPVPRLRLFKIGVKPSQFTISEPMLTKKHVFFNL